MKIGDVQVDLYGAVAARPGRKVWVGGLTLLAAVGLLGCGGSVGQSNSTAGLLKAPAQGSAGPAASKTIAIVGGIPIAAASLEHWLTVTANIEDSSGKTKGKAAPKPPTYSACVAAQQRLDAKQTVVQARAKCESEYVKLETKALGFLISSDWIRGEAANLHLSASHQEDKERLDELRGKYYPKGSKFTSFLSSSGETIGDVLWRIEGELLGSRISEAAIRGRTRTTEEHVALKEYQEEFQARWKSRTNCSAGYVIEDCEQFKIAAAPAKTPQQRAQRREEHVYREELREKKEIEKEEAVTGKKFAKGETVKNNPSRGYSRQARTNGETYNTLGGMNLTSPAFEVNGQIPVEYTCDGRGISPPISWARVPTGAKSLLLYVIDDSQDSFTDPTGGVRWMLANINPELGGISAGQVPEGAVVGMGNDGKVDYGAICPEKGKTDQIEFLIYAFKEKFDIKPGFTEQEVQGQYTANGNKMLSENATTYGVYTRQ